MRNSLKQLGVEGVLNLNFGWICTKDIAADWYAYFIWVYQHKHLPLLVKEIYELLGGVALVLVFFFKRRLT
jgi:hypothetical protein